MWRRVGIGEVASLLSLSKERKAFPSCVKKRAGRSCSYTTRSLKCGLPSQMSHFFFHLYKYKVESLCPMWFKHLNFGICLPMGRHHFQAASGSHSAPAPSGRGTHRRSHCTRNWNMVSSPPSHYILVPPWQWQWLPKLLAECPCTVYTRVRLQFPSTSVHSGYSFLRSQNCHTN